MPIRRVERAFLVMFSAMAPTIHPAEPVTMPSVTDTISVDDSPAFITAFIPTHEAKPIISAAVFVEFTENR